MNKVWFFLFLVACIGGYFGYIRFQEYKHDIAVGTKNEADPEKPLEEAPSKQDQVEPVIIEPVEKEEKKIVSRSPLTMSFVVQAPNAEWSDERFENACEEASLLMVGAWLKGDTVTDPKKEMLAIMAYEEKIFGHSYDTSATDTHRILQEYYGVTESRVEVMESEKQLRTLVESGNVLIIPTDGKKLKNPFFTPPGPDVHMLVVLAYDAQAKAYIVNDPGTKRGAKYTYKEEVLFEAIRDYPTASSHKPAMSNQKNAIVISSKQVLESPAK